MLGTVVVASKHVGPIGLFAGGWFPAEPHAGLDVGHYMGPRPQGLNTLRSPLLGERTTIRRRPLHF